MVNYFSLMNIKENMLNFGNISINEKECKFYVVRNLDLS